MSPARFVDYYTKELFQAALSAPPHLSPTPSPHTQKLQAILQTFRSSSESSSRVREILLVLQNKGDGSNESQFDNGEIQLRKAAIGIVIAWIYGQSLALFLKQATAADAEANWWSEVERSKQRLLWYFLETLPLRIMRVFDTIVNALRARNSRVTPLSFTPRSLRQLFPTTSRPSRLQVSFFPHLSAQPHILLRSPFELCRQECRYRDNSLQKIRDNRADRLGWLAAHRDKLHAALASHTEDMIPLVKEIKQAIDDAVPVNNSGDQVILVEVLSDIVFNRLPRATISHDYSISEFLRPSRLTRMWPRIILIPPIALVLFRLIYGTRGSLGQHLHQALKTVSGFWRGYLVQPFREILDTIRTEGEEGVRIVSREGVRSDMESLERMAMSLLRDRSTLHPGDLTGLSMQIQRGDLTSILKIYEEDLKSPLKSAVTGTLIRSLLIQVHKMKVDVDIALSGIDKLLKSQELTFAFVGVAPALAIVYGFVGWVRHIWFGMRGMGKYGGKRRRQVVWHSIRRIERLLTVSATSSPLRPARLESLTSLDQGLILLSVTQLRAYAETCLPPHSLLRQEFLVDVSDLEDPLLGRQEKMEVMERMWRSWGNVLKWSSMGEM